MVSMEKTDGGEELIILNSDYDKTTSRVRRSRIPRSFLPITIHKEIGSYPTDFSRIV